MSVSGALNGFFQHWHLYDAKVWTAPARAERLAGRATYGLGSARSEFLFRAFMPPAFVEFVAKKLTGFYPSKLARFLPHAALAPSRSSCAGRCPIRWSPVDSPTAYEYLIVAEAPS